MKKENKKEIYSYDELEGGYSFDELEKERKEFERKHPILNKIQDGYYWCYRNLNIKDYYREVKWFIQRGFRGYSDRDLWNIDVFFRGTILKGLKAFKKKDRSGFPAHLTDDNIIHEQASVKWEKILDDMIDGLDYITTDHIATKVWEEFEQKKITREEYNKKTDRLYKEAQEKAMLFIKHLPAIWD